MKSKLFVLVMMVVLTATAVTPLAAAPLLAPCAPGAAYDPTCDVNHDGVVNVLDIQLTAGHWNQTGTWLSDNSHNHLGQLWTGNTPLKIQGAFGAPDYAPLLLNNTAGVGLSIAASDTAVYVDSAGYHGLWVASAASDGLHVNSAGNDGVYVGAAGQDGLFVCHTGNAGSCVPDATTNNGVEIGNAQHNGMRVISAGWNGVVVDSAGGDGMYVGAAGQDGLFICRTGSAGSCTPSEYNNGVEIGSAQGYGVYVGSAATGVRVNSAAGSGVSVNSAAFDGLRVNSAGNDGVFVDLAGRHGVFVSAANVDGVSANTTQASGQWGLYTPDAIHGSNVLMHSLSLVGQVTGPDSLTPGDIVAVAGVADPAPGSTVHTPLVRLAGGTFTNVVGVVESHLALPQQPSHPQPVNGETITETLPAELRSVDGPAQAGDYVAITVMGAALVKVQDGETILAGQRLTAGDGGSVRALQSRTIEGMVVTEGAPVIGVALEAAKDGLVWVMVNPQ